MPILVQACLKCGAHVYLQAMRLQQAHVHQGMVGVIEQELDALVRAMRCLGKIFPIAGELLGAARGNIRPKLIDFVQ